MTHDDTTAVEFPATSAAEKRGVFASKDLFPVRDDRVECSNGNGVSRAAVERALPVILARRKDYGALTLPLGGYQINALSSSGVKIGCTLIAWPEVDRLKIMLASHQPSR